MRYGISVLTCAVLAGLSAVVAGCGGATPGTTQPTSEEAVTAAYAAALAAIAADATVIERAAASVAGSRDGTGNGGDQNRRRHRQMMGDGTAFDVDGDGSYSVLRPDGTEVTGSPDGPRQIRHRNRMMNADWEDQGGGQGRRLRVHLPEGADCVVSPADDPNGEMQCEGPGGWQFRVRENEDGSLLVRFGHHSFTVTRDESGALTINMPDGTRWTAEVQDDGSILVSNPSGHAMWTVVVNEDGSLTVTHVRSGQTFVVLPGNVSDDDGADSGTESGEES